MEGEIAGVIQEVVRTHEEDVQRERLTKRICGGTDGFGGGMDLRGFEMKK